MEVIFILSVLVSGIIFSAKQVTSPEPEKRPEVPVAVRVEPVAARIEPVKVETPKPALEASEKLVSKIDKSKPKKQRKPTSKSSPQPEKVKEANSKPPEQEKRAEATSGWGTKKELSNEKWK